MTNNLKNIPLKISVSDMSYIRFKPLIVGGIFCTDYHYVSKVMSEIRSVNGNEKIKKIASKILYTQYWCNYSIDNIEGEIWKDLPNEYFGVYMVSSHGRVKRLIGYSCWTERILKQNVVRGACTVTLSVNSSKKNFLVHRLVASVFVPLVQGKPIIHHNNDISLHNHYTNLIRCTQRENVQEGFKKGRICNNLPKSLNGVNHHSFGRKLSDQQKLKISNSKKKYSNDLLNEILLEYKLGARQVDLSKKYNISASYISQLVNHKNIIKCQ